MLISVNEQSLSLRGYSRTCNFIITNIHPSDYTSFQIKGHPEQQFIIIPENGALMPRQTKQIKLYLSRNSMKKENIQNCFLEVSAWKLNQSTIGRQNAQVPQKIVLPIIVSSEYSILKIDNNRSNSQGSNRGLSSKYGSFRDPSEGNFIKKLSRNSSIESSISMHSRHDLEDSPPKHSPLLRSQPPLQKTYTPPSTSPFMGEEKFIINAMMKTALSSVQLNNKYTNLLKQKQHLIAQQASLQTKNVKVKDNNLQFLIMCIFVAISIVLGSYTHILYRKFE